MIAAPGGHNRVIAAACARPFNTPLRPSCLAVSDPSPERLSMVKDREPSARAGELRLAELLGALSHALDMVEGQPAGHCVRTCWIGLHIGRELQLDETAIREL